MKKRIVVFLLMMSVIIPPTMSRYVGQQTMSNPMQVLVKRTVDQSNLVNLAMVNATVSEGEGPQSDNKNTINDGQLVYSKNTAYRWTNFRSAKAGILTAYVQYNWTVPHHINEIDAFFFTDTNNARVPASVALAYSYDGKTFQNMTLPSVTFNPVPYDGVSAPATKFVLPEILHNVKAVRFYLTAQNGKCAGLTELQVWGTP